MDNYSLTPKLAQEIVDRTMKIIDCNINVMDKHGYIIGSGDLERIGELHEGAMLAISKERIVSIDSPTAQNLQGVKPGLNLPLRLNNQIVGVIGLTGEPSTINQFGRLVCVSAEMMMEQVQLINELTQDNRLKEEIIFTLIEDGTISANMHEWVKRLSIELEVPRVAAIVEVDSGQLGIDTAMRQLHDVRSIIESGNSHSLAAIQSLTELVVLMPALNRFERWDFDEHQQRLERLEREIHKVCGLEVRVALGNYFPQGVNWIAKSYQTAKTTMQVGKQRLPKSRIYYYQKLILPVLLHGLSVDWHADELLQPLKKLQHADSNGTLMKTLQVWFNHNLNSKETAAALFIHRNTLEYRLNKIADITKLNLSSIDDRTLLYIALQLKAEQ